MESIFLPASKQRGFRLEFLFNRPLGGELFEELRVPFLTLYSLGRYSRILAGRVVSENNRAIKYLALKIQKDEYDLGLGPGSHVGVTNTNVESMWERELENLCKVDPAERHIVSFFEWGLQQPIKPVLFCKKQRLFLRPRCPSCSEKMTVCREENLLSRRMLTLYTKGLKRYLYCPGCSGTNQEDVCLYSHLPSKDDAEKGVLGPDELFRDVIGSRVNGSATLPKDQELRGELIEDLFCISCQNNQECFASESDPGGSGLARKYLTPLGFYDFYLLPLEFLDCRYDAFSKALSGADADSVALPVWDDVAGGDPESGPVELPESLVQHRKFLFPAGALRAQEVFYLKISLFHQLCMGVWQFYTSCKKPVLTLRPENVMVSILDNGGNLPNAWSFEVKLIDLPSAQVFQLDPELGNHFADIYHPVRDLDANYAAPVLKGPFGPRGRVGFALGEIEDSPAGKGDVLHIIRGHLSSDEMDLRQISQKDLLRLTVHQEVLGLFGTRLWARKVSEDGKECLIEGVAYRLKKGELERLRQIINRKIEVPFAVFPAYNIPCDLFSLGMLLLDTLLLSESNSRLDIRDVHKSICNLMDDYVFNHPHADESEIARYFHDICGNDRPAKVLSRKNVIFQCEEPMMEVFAIPDLLWTEALGTAFRLASFIPGFSFCRDHGDFFDDRPEEKLEAVMLQVQSLAEKVHTELFQRHKANLEILPVLREVGTQLIGKLSGGEPSPLAGYPLSSENTEEERQPDLSGQEGIGGKT